jgi:ferric-dicitrate binding protein FerR (iron transport regulator)
MQALDKEEQVRLIVKYLSGNASDDEVRTLKCWIENSDADKTYYQQVKNIWEIATGAGDVRVISSDKALEAVLNKLAAKKQSHSIFYYWQRIAAILLIPVLIGSYIWIRSISGGVLSDVTYNEVFAAFGTRSAIKLADGSKVWLNSGSSLRYPDKFVRKQRTVFLSGEAYFEVHSDKSRPFIVQTATITVKATGTKFNVSAYKNEGNMHVTLVEGKVSVSNNKSQMAVLNPNQHLSFDTLTQKVTISDNTDVYKFIAWKDGKLVFRNEPLSLVIKKIGQYYNVDIELTGKEIQEYRYRATFQEESLDEILKLLKISSPINYKEVNRKPLSDGSFPKRKIIIYPNSDRN